ncbi:helix-turn-helix domain-containing protein [Leptospira barantonii]|nr:helix-turn-helix transcriptional regulator [Leptospira barantonii]
MNNFDISKILRKLMQRHGWTQEELAKIGGVKQATISRYLNEGSLPNLEFLIRLYKSKGVDPIIFVRDFEEEPINFELGSGRADKQKLVEDVTQFLRFIKNSPDALEIFWKIYNLDENGRKATNAFVDKILEQ